MRRPRICRVVTVPLTFHTLLRAQVRRVCHEGFDLTLVCSADDSIESLASSIGARFAAVPMRRQLSPGADAGALAALVRLFRRERFDLVHSSTPKAGLLTALAGRLVGTPHRLHTFTGQPWVELTGPLRRVARGADRAIGHLSTHLYADSHSQRAFLEAEGICPPGKVRVIGHGSLSGVDTRRFDPQSLAGERDRVRGELGISSTARVVVFVGRVTRDKGIRELLDAFLAVSTGRGDVELLLVGPFERERERDALPAETLAALESSPRVHAVGFKADPERFLAAADVFCLPSYREGFGSVAIEAGALGLPVVATRINGLTDAVTDGLTGRLVAPKDTVALTEALGALLDDPHERRRLGAEGRRRALQLFDAEIVDGAVIREYATVLGMS